MLHLSENIKLIRALSKKNQTDFGKKFDATKAMIVSYESGKARPDNLFLARLSNYTDVPQKMLTDEALAEDDINVEKLEKAFQKLELNESEVNPYLITRLDRKNFSVPFLVPLVPIKAQAGYIVSYDQADFISSLETYPIAPGINPRGQEWRWFEVDGDSMEPNFYKHDFILCSMVPPTDWGDIKDGFVHVIVTEKQIMVKRILVKNAKTWALASDNKAYAQIPVNVEDVKEVWKFRRNLNARVPPGEKIKIEI